MQLQVVVPGWLAPRPWLDELLRQREPVGREEAVHALPQDWHWEHTPHKPRLFYTLEQSDESLLLDTVLATGRRERDGRQEFCRIDTLCTVVLRVCAGRPAAQSYAELATVGDDIAESLADDIAGLCHQAEGILSGRVRPAADGALPGGRPLWGHRVVVLEPGDAPPSGGAPVPVRAGLTIDNGQTCIDPATNDVDGVIRALELATVHWLVVDDLNRELFARVRELHDEVIGTEESLEAAYYSSMSVTGMVSAVEMLLDDQRLALPPAERDVYDAYMRQWSLADLRVQIRVRAKDVVDHSGRRLEFVRTRLVARTNVVLLLLSFVTLVPGVLVVEDFLSDPAKGRLRPTSAGHVVFALVALLAATATVVILLTVHRRAARRLPGERRRS